MKPLFEKLKTFRTILFEGKLLVPTNTIRLENGPNFLPFKSFLRGLKAAFPKPSPLRPSTYQKSIIRFDFAKPFLTSNLLSIRVSFLLCSLAHFRSNFKRFLFSTFSDLFLVLRGNDMMAKFKLVTSYFRYIIIPFHFV